MNQREGRRFFAESGQSILEYMTLMVFLLSALFVFQQYIVRAYTGNWKKSGDSFAHGEQYDPRVFGSSGEGGGTAECFFAPQVSRWVDKDCYQTGCPDCALYSSQSTCILCANACASSICQD